MKSGFRLWQNFLKYTFSTHLNGKEAVISNIRRKWQIWSYVNTFGSSLLFLHSNLCLDLKCSTIRPVDSSKWGIVFKHSQFCVGKWQIANIFFWEVFLLNLYFNLKCFQHFDFRFFCGASSSSDSYSSSILSWVSSTSFV